MKNIFYYIELMRPHQYIKNSFIFAPLFFAFRFDLPTIKQCLFVFVCFSLIASAVYIFNDYRDRKSDALHPIKKNRPLASGKLDSRNALCLAACLIFFGGGGLFVLGWPFVFLTSLYLCLNLLYSLKLKQIAIFDVCIITVGFIIRLFLGALAGNVELSHWIIITTFFLSLFLAFCKRRDDIQLLEQKGIKARKSLDGYSLPFADFCIGISATMSILSYVMWSISPLAVVKIHSPYLYLTSFFVVLGILRYAQQVYVFSNGGSPTQVVLKDIFMHCILFGWIMSFIILVLGDWI